MVDTLYLVHHSHTDIGYTHDQPVLWELQLRFLDHIIDLAEADLEVNADHAFHWTVETTAVLHKWLHQAPPDQIDRFLRLVEAGRIEVTGMLCNSTPLYDRTQFIESLQGLHRLRTEYGIPVRHAMNCDVNGQNWSIVDCLLDAGVESFSMAINTHFGGFPFHRPYPFWWRAPSGRKLFTLNGFHYFAGWRMGIGRDARDFEGFWWPELDSWLKRTHYPLSSLMVQTIHPFGDNGTGDVSCSRFIEDWNATGKLPRLVFSTPSRWMEAIKNETDRIPDHRGDWTDFWNFGCGSSAREVRINRQSRFRLICSDAMSSLSHPTSSHPESNPRSDALREEAWHCLNFFDEHTWGVDLSARDPENDDTVSQWNHKANYAYRARSFSTLLQRDSLADITSQFLTGDPDRFVVFNPLPWSRTLAGPVNAFSFQPRGLPEDETAGRHFQDHGEMHRFPTDGPSGITSAECHVLPPTVVPGLGVSIVQRDQLRDWKTFSNISESDSIENHRYRLNFDPVSGRMISWRDKSLEREWLTDKDGLGVNHLVHESVDGARSKWLRSEFFETDWGARSIEMPEGWKRDWPAKRESSLSLVESRNFISDLGTYRVSYFTQANLAGVIRETIFLPSYAEWIEFESTWNMGRASEPEATYLAFNFTMGKPVVRFDAGGQCVRIEKDQIPGCCKDYFTTQNWVDMSDGEFGVTIATPENPMFQIGGFNFGQHLEKADPNRALFLGWITNNYWETNFRAHQPGQVSARYRILPYRGEFAETRAIRLGLEAADRALHVQHGGEQRSSRLTGCAPDSFLRFTIDEDPSHPVFPIQLKEGTDGGILVRLHNASGDRQETWLSGGILMIEQVMEADFFGNPVREMKTEHGKSRVLLGPRETKSILLTTRFVNE